MGSYGIGVERTAASFIEQNNDEKGIVWKGEVAPFKVILLSLNQSDEEVKKVSEEFYKQMDIIRHKEVLFDDREGVRPGIKFNDADLIGIPLQVIVGEKNLKEGNVEIKIRRSGERIILKKEDAVEKIIKLISEN